MFGRYPLNVASILTIHLLKRNKKNRNLIRNIGNINKLKLRKSQKEKSTVGIKILPSEPEANNSPKTLKNKNRYLHKA